MGPNVESNYNILFITIPTFLARQAVGREVFNVINYSPTISAHLITPKIILNPFGDRYLVFVVVVVVCLFGLVWFGLEGEMCSQCTQ